MANRKKPVSKQSRPIGVSIPKDIAAAARRRAFIQGMSFSAFVTRLLARELEAAK